MNIRNIKIKHRVLLLQVLSVLILLIFYLLLNLQKKELTEFSLVDKLIKNTQINMLSLRRHEKDFMTRLESRYSEKHQTQFASTENELIVLQQYLQLLDIPSEIPKILSDLNAYNRQFLLLVKLHKEIGFNYDDGLQGEIHSLINRLQNEGNLGDDLKTKMLALKRIENLFLISNDATYAAQFNQAFQQYRPLFKAPFASKLDQYSAYFLRLVQLKKELGYNHEVGVQGKMRNQIHQMEAGLSELLDVLQPVLAAKVMESSTKITSLIVLIALVTTLLLLLIGRSITLPIKRIVYDIELLRRGGREIKFESSPDELGKVFKQLEEFQADLKDLDLLREKEQQYQAELIADKAALESALNEVKQMQGKLVQSEKMASLGALVAGVSHEINTPIGIAVTMGSTFQQNLKHFLTVLKSGKMRRSDLEQFEEDTQEGLNVLLPALDKASSLIHSFKQVAIDQTSEERRVFNLAEVIDEVMLTLHHQIKRTQIEFISDVDSNIEMDSYPGPLGQVITNLFNNALIHGFDELDAGSISIIGKQRNKQVMLVVRDTGKGIEKAHLSKIFDPFFTTKLGQGGSGLGLNIIFNKVVSLMAGEINVESEPGKGTCFTILLPLVASKKGASDE